MVGQLQLENCVTLRPTIEEFRDEKKFLASEAVQDAGKKCGIVRVVCPTEFQPGVSNNLLATSENSTEVLPNVIEQMYPPIAGYASGEGYYLVQLRQDKGSPLEKHLLNESAVKWKGITEKDMVKNHWKRMSKENQKDKSYTFDDDPRTHFWESRPYQRAAFYGCDIQETRMKPDLECWNFGSTKFPCLTNFLEEEDRTAGISTPYLYFGSWGSAFGLHCEDKDLYSLNYLHEGDSKFWYGFPSNVSEDVVKFARELVPKEAAACPEFVRHKELLVEPRHFLAKGIPVFAAEQKFGDLIITFPNAFHYGFNSGFNLAESRNIATLDWIDWGLEAKCCSCGRMDDVLPHEFIVEIAMKADPVKYGHLGPKSGQKPVQAGLVTSQEPKQKRIRRM